MGGVYNSGFLLRHVNDVTAQEHKKAACTHRVELYVSDCVSRPAS